MAKLEPGISFSGKAARMAPKSLSYYCSAGYNTGCKVSNEGL